MEHQDLELKHIGTVDDKRYFISTIKMHVRHSWLNQHNNVFVYETMIFKKEDGKVIYHEPVYNKRYNSYEDAINGHQYVVENTAKIIKEGILC
ncbi:hypothetical protein [Arcobacter roscoffensis]|uniref:Uncharacterized protein n=1 Tax=Arcobacter roscoffensis TaxID=2961520 RepID=A0ABY5E2R4_9BACT|nr:hypothetical protein [Arcobacter roscoffensis]UTJ05859.1 hypothetical protein NJU99_11450 [Arcobacter roscoffensis]